MTKERDGEDSARDIVKAALKLEFRTDAGRVNSSVLALCAFIIMFAGATDLVEPLIRIWRPEYSSDFPWIAVLALYLAGLLICVSMLVVLDVLLQPGSPRQADHADIRDRSGMHGSEESVRAPVQFADANLDRLRSEVEPLDSGCQGKEQ